MKKKCNKHNDLTDKIYDKFLLTLRLKITNIISH